MVKIFELTDKQLNEQIEKYQKILQELINEKSGRLKIEPFNISLDFSPKVASKKNLDEDKKVDQVEDGLSFSETEIRNLQAIKQHVEEQVGEEEVAVTRLLKLSKEQLKKLKS